MSRGFWAAVLVGVITGWIVADVTHHAGMSYWWAILIGYLAAIAAMLVIAWVHDRIRARRKRNGFIPPPRHGA